MMVGNDDDYGNFRWQAKLERFALVIGLAGNVALTFLFVPVTRGSSILAYLGLTSEASMKYHMWLANIAMVCFTAHGALYIIYWALTNRLSEVNFTHIFFFFFPN